MSILAVLSGTLKALVSGSLPEKKFCNAAAVVSRKGKIACLRFLAVRAAIVTVLLLKLKSECVKRSWCEQAGQSSLGKG